MDIRFVWQRLTRMLGFKKLPTIEHTPVGVPRINYTLLLWIPKYDNRTRHTAAWFRTLSIPANIVRVSLRGSVLTKADIQAALTKVNSQFSLAIFVGHGWPDALLGPPRPKAAKHSVIYGREQFPHGPSALFAFCCNSGQELGRWFAATPERVFLGYEDSIVIIVRDDDCSGVWRGILHKVCAAMMKDGTILPKHVELLKDLYDKALQFYRDGEGKNSPERIDMEMALLDHRRSLRYWGNIEKASAVGEA